MFLPKLPVVYGVEVAQQRPLKRVQLVTKSFSADLEIDLFPQALVLTSWTVQVSLAQTGCVGQITPKNLCIVFEWPVCDDETN